MITIAEVVGQMVERSPFITEALAEGLLNISALARRLRPEIEQSMGKQVKAGAIIMAIKRMQFGALTYAEKDLHLFFRKLSDISVRSNLLDYTFANSEGLIQKQARLLEHIGQQAKGFYSFSQGIAETTLIINEDNGPFLEQLFKPEKLLDKEEDLSSITLMLPAENRTLHGVYYYILKDLAWNGINLIELISTSNEFTILVKNEDLDQAFSVLINLRSMKRQ